MTLSMWMLDIAREQCPTLDHLRRYCRLTLESGYDAIGLYLEHRFAYPSAPWAHGVGCVTPDMVQQLQREFKGLQIVPFINLLGHFEGMLYTEFGKRFAEERLRGLQACASNPEFARLCESMIDDVLDCFSSELIHLGGDETAQLGKCPLCKEKLESSSAADPKAELYGEHFKPLIERVAKAGRRPGMWADMFLEHPDALAIVPKDTLMFDWHYNESCEPTTRKLMDAGFDVVCCPTLHIYNATWCHVPESERNVRQALADVRACGAYGFCLTTWECGLFGAYDSVLPMVAATGKLAQISDESTDADPQRQSESTAEVDTGPAGILPADTGAFIRAYAVEDPTYAEWAYLMGQRLQTLGPPFAFTGIRSSLKCRLLLFGNPFLAWFHHYRELSGKTGDEALALFEEALRKAPNEAAKGVTLFARGAVEFVRIAEQARQFYSIGQPAEAIARLALTRQIFDDLATVAKKSHERIGGSLADIERCRVAKEHVEKVIRRIRDYGDGSLGYLPAFEVLASHHFMPHDQASWWVINRWGNEQA